MPLSLRLATNRDREAVQRLVFTVLDEYGLAPEPQGIDADLSDLEGNFADAGGTFELLVNEREEVVGCVGIYRLSETTCELRKMYLAAAYRGRGEGRRLLEHGLQRAAQLGFSRVVLETASVLREAIGLYERHGFRPYATDHLAGRCDAAYYLDLPRA